MQIWSVSVNQQMLILYIRIIELDRSREESLSAIDFPIN